MQYSYLNNVDGHKSIAKDSPVLSDGTIARFVFNKNPDTTESSIRNNLPEYVGNIYVDVNGTKGPNTVGRDYFEFWLFNDGSIHSEGSVFFNKWDTDDADFNWKTTSEISCNCSTENGVTSEGTGCLARIMDEGWKMTY